MKDKKTVFIAGISIGFCLVYILHNQNNNDVIYPITIAAILFLSFILTPVK